MIKNLIFISLILFFISGCSSSKTTINIPKTNSSVEHPPTWYIQPKQDDELYFYAVAIGKTKREAKLIALNEINSRFGLKVSSTYNKELTYNTKVTTQLHRKVKEKFSASTNEIVIKEYDITKYKRASYKQHYIEIKVNKTTLFTTMYEDLQNEIAQYSKSINAARNRNELIKLNLYRDIYNQIDRLYQTTLYLQTLKPNYNLKNFSTFIKNIENKYLYYKNNLKAYIIPDRNSLNFKDSVINSLVNSNIIISRNMKKTNFLVKVKTTKSTSNSRHFNLSIFSITLQLLSKNELLGHKTYIIKEVTKESKTYVEKKASLQLKEMLKNKTLFEIFDIKP